MEHDSIRSILIAEVQARGGRQLADDVAFAVALFHELIIGIPGYIRLHVCVPELTLIVANVDLCLLERGGIAVE